MQIPANASALARWKTAQQFMSMLWAHTTEMKELNGNEAKGTVWQAPNLTEVLCVIAVLHVQEAWPLPVPVLAPAA